MSTDRPLHILLIDDSLTDAEQLTDAFSEARDVVVTLTHVQSLEAALEHLRAERFDLLMVDLSLPDSQGVSTFVQLNRAAPAVPVLVLASSDEEALALQAVEQGAQDYLVKPQIVPPLVTRSVRYAVERSRLQQELARTRQREQQERESSVIDRLSQGPGTDLTSRMFSNASLRETDASLFAQLIERYHGILRCSLEERIFKGTTDRTARVQELADDLGGVRASPRDVVDIHRSGLKGVVDDVPWQRAQAYMCEGRISPGADGISDGVLPDAVHASCTKGIGSMTNYTLTLYITGNTSRARRAIATLERLCDVELGGQYAMVVIDVLERPQLAEAARILATPTLIKQSPPPLRRVIGDLTDTSKVLLGLDIVSVQAGAYKEEHHAQH